MIRKKHITLCFSLFLALSIVLGQLIPVTATGEVPAEAPAPVEETVTPAPEPVKPDPEPGAGEEPGVTPTVGETPDHSGEGEPGPTAPAGDGQGGETTNPTEDVTESTKEVEEAKPEEEDKAAALADEEGLVPVYVYVVAQDSSGQAFSQEMLDLLQVKTKNTNNYFAAGTVTLDPTKLSGNIAGKIKKSNDWEYIIQRLQSSFNPSNSIDNPQNLIGNYLGSIKRDYATTSTSTPSSGMWASYLAVDPATEGVVGNKYIGGRIDSNGNLSSFGSNCWHLDLRFECAKITYLYGKNGLTGQFADNKEIGSKVFISGAVMDYEPEIKVPAGYRIVGYYQDPEFTKEWSAIGKPIEGMDNKVYVKVVPENDVVIHYLVKEGKGSVTDPSRTSTSNQEGWDFFNPWLENPETPIGSTATAAENWVFDGWYSDADLTNKVSSNANYTPRVPDEGWDNKIQYTYYAKFVEKMTTLVVSNSVSGNAASKDQYFNYELIVTNPDTSETKTHKFQLKHGEQSGPFTYPASHTYVVKQTDGLDHETIAEGKRTESQVAHGAYNSSDQSHSGDMNEDTSVQFMNSKNLTVPTGMEEQNNGVHGLILSAGAGVLLLVAIVAIRRRMNAI